MQVGIAANNLVATQQQRAAQLKQAQDALQSAEANMTPIEAAQTRLDQVKESAPPSISDPGGKPVTAKPKTGDFVSRPRVFGTSAAIVLLAGAFVAALAWNGSETQAAQNRHATATALVQAHARSTRSAIASKTALVKAALAKRTRTARAHSRATAQALTQRTKLAAAAAAAPGQTATAVAQATAAAISAANSKATSQAAATVSSGQTATASVLFDQRGNGITTGRRFNAPSEWRIDYSWSNCEIPGFDLYVNGDVDDIVSRQGNSGSGTTYEHSGGSVYLTMNTACDWRVTATAGG